MRIKGRVKWFNASKGFGFLQMEGGHDVFAHYTQISGEGFKTLPENAEVEFTLEETERGAVALDIRVCNSSS